MNADRESLVNQLKSSRAELLATPSKSQIDKKIKYIRYADDFLIRVKGSKSDCILLKQRLSGFIAEQLKMELSNEKTLITHSNNRARFLGYEVRVRLNNEIKPSKKGGLPKRTLNGSVELSIPFDEKVVGFMFRNGIIKQVNGDIHPTHRSYLLHCSELEILMTYNFRQLKYDRARQPIQ